MFDYPFHTLGCKKLIAVMEKSNAKALQLNSRMGFKFEAEIEDVFSSGPAVIRSLRVEDCRFLDERFRCAFERYLETRKAAA
jgi:RimJ/RimL family protein N-acetyltransferase